MSRQAPSRAAEREPDGDLASSRRGPRQLQHREIRADDQQDGQRSDNAERGREHQNARLDDCGILNADLRRQQADADIRVGRGIRRFELSREVGGDSLRPFEIEARPESSDHEQRTATASVQQPWRAWLHDRLHADRNPDLGPESQPPHALESTRRHAGHDELAAVDADDAPGDIRIALKPALPCVVAEDDERIASLRRVGGGEETADRRTGAEDGEEILRHDLRPDHVARRVPGGLRHDEIHGSAGHRREAGECPAAVAEIDEVVVAERAGVAGPGVAGEQGGELLGSLCRHRTEQDAVDVAEDDPVHADAEPQRERGGEDETRVTAHPLDCVPHVRAQVIEPARPTFVAHRLAITLDRAECDERPPPRFGRRHAFTNQMLGFGLEVKSELLVETRLRVTGPKNRTGAGSQPLPADSSTPRRSG